MLLLIDNYDSFTYNLFQYLSELGEEVRVVRNDRITLDEIEGMKPERIVVSPGPSTPLNAGISNDVIRHFGDKVPILGVCLGHQCIGYSYGGTVGPAQAIMHGKSSPVYHNNSGVFKGLPNLSGRSQGKTPRLSGDNRLDRGQHHYGNAPPPIPGGRRAVPPRVLYDPRREGYIKQFLGQGGSPA